MLPDLTEWGSGQKTRIYEECNDSIDFVSKQWSKCSQLLFTKGVNYTSLNSLLRNGDCDTLCHNCNDYCCENRHM